MGKVFIGLSAAFLAFIFMAKGCQKNGSPSSTEPQAAASSAPLPSLDQELIDRFAAMSYQEQEQFLISNIYSGLDKLGAKDKTTLPRLFSPHVYTLLNELIKDADLHKANMTKRPRSAADEAARIEIWNRIDKMSRVLEGIDPIPLDTAPLLRNLANNPESGWARDRAVNAYFRIKQSPDEEVTRLSETIKSPYPWLRQRTITRLGELGKAATPMLTTMKYMLEECKKPSVTITSNPVRYGNGYIIAKVAPDINIRSEEMTTLKLSDQDKSALEGAIAKIEN